MNASLLAGNTDQLSRLELVRLRAREALGLWHEHELSLRCRTLQQLVRTTSVGQRQALCDDRVDPVCAKQFEQRLKILPEPVRVAGLPAHCAGSSLSSVAELLDLVGEHPPTGREHVP